MPFYGQYVPILEEMAKARNAVFQSIHIQAREDVQNTPIFIFTESLDCSGWLHPLYVGYLVIISPRIVAMSSSQAVNSSHAEGYGRLLLKKGIDK